MQSPAQVGAADLVREINSRTGSELDFVGVAADGVSGGAVYVQWPDGRAGVVTYVETSLERLRLTTSALDLARAAGISVPGHLHAVTLTDGRIAVVQDRLPGNPIRRIDPDLVDRVVAVNDRFAGLLADLPEVPTQRLHLRESASDHPRHEPLEAYSDRTRRMLARIRQIGHHGPDEVGGQDLVHPDFARGNILVNAAGAVTGVVDWSSGALRGDRHFALVSLRSDLEWRKLWPNSDNVPDAAVARLDEILRARMEPGVLQSYWAFWTLHKVYCAITEGSPDELDLWLGFGEEWL